MEGLSRSSAPTAPGAPLGQSSSVSWSVDGAKVVLSGRGTGERKERENHERMTHAREGYDRGEWGGMGEWGGNGGEWGMGNGAGMGNGERGNGGIPTSPYSLIPLFPYSPIPHIPPYSLERESSAEPDAPHWPPVVPVIWPNVLPAAVLKPVFGLPQRTELVTLNASTRNSAYLGCCDREPLEQRAVELPEARAFGTRVPAHVALRAGGRLRIDGRIEVQLARPEAADDRCRPHPVRIGAVARRVEQRAVGADAQRLARLRDEQRADLPPADDLARQSVGQPAASGADGRS